MAVVRVKRLGMLAHAGERDAIMRLLTESGAAEVAPMPVPDGLKTETADFYELDSKTAKAEFGIYFIKEIYKLASAEEGKKLPRLNFKRENKLYDLEEYYSVKAEENFLFAKTDEMKALMSEMVESKSRLSRIRAEKEQLKAYLNINTPFSAFVPSRYTDSFLGLIPSERREEFIEKIGEIPAEIFTFDSVGAVAVAAVCLKENTEELTAALTAFEFQRCAFDHACTASERCRVLDGEASEIEKRRKGIVSEGESYFGLLEKFKILYDAYSLDKETMKAGEMSARTGETFMLEAWVPAAKAESLKKTLAEKCEYLFIEFRDPTEGETPPTILKNNKFAGAFEDIIAMFGMPGYRERDPSIFVAIFYFLFFGIMISDAGYGLLLAIGCFLVLKLKKPVKNSGRMLTMFAFCGIATVIWGALFGGWFSITLREGSLLDKIKWFNPMDEPLKMFLLAIGAGAVQMAVGFALKGVDEIKSGHIAHGIFAQFGWVVIFIALGLLFPTLTIFLGAVRVSETPAWVSVCADVALYFGLTGFAMIIVGGVVGKKNVIKAVGGAFGSVYGSINVVSDLLSYSRLFGLGLTTGVIGYVVNMLADLIVNTFFGGGWYGWIVAVPVLIVGHAFNMSINLLGAYVHDSRLQYVEFFGRFYEGHGHAFKPLGASTRYTYLNN